MNFPIALRYVRIDVSFDPYSSGIPEIELSERIADTALV